MRRLVLPIVAVAVLAAAGAGGWYWWTELRFLESTDNAYLHSDISVIAPKVSGYVAAVPVTDNQQVRAGDLLVRINPDSLQAAVDDAAASVAEARASIAANEREQSLQQSRIEQAEAATQADEAQLTLAQREFKRAKDLVARAVMSHAKYDTAETSLQKAQAALTEAKAGIGTARKQLAYYAAERERLQAQLSQAEARLEAARIDLANSEIRAPVDGVVGNRGVQVGQYVQPGTHLLSIVPLDSVYVVANFKETQIENMRPGQTVTLEVDAYPGQPIEGRIESFAPASGAVFSLLPAQNATGNFTKIVQRVPIKISVPADSPLSGRLRPGLSVVAEVDTRSAPAGPQLAER